MDEKYGKRGSKIKRSPSVYFPPDNNFQYVLLYGRPGFLEGLTPNFDHIFTRYVRSRILQQFIHLVSILSATVTGMLMRIIISSSWTYLDAMLFGMMFTSIYPAHVLRWLKTSTMQTKYVTALLNGETLISAAFSIFIFKMLLHHYEQWVIHWYQFVTGFARQFLLGKSIFFKM
jgi:hypothetical protein